MRPRPARSPKGERDHSQSRSEEKLRAAQASLPGKVEAGALDVADSASVEAFFNAAPIYDHIVVSGAASKFGTARDQNIDDAHAAMNVKFWGAYRVARKARVAADGSFVYMKPFGLEANRRNLEVAIDCCQRQQFIPRRFALDELFDDVTRELAA